jgi:hypothetical protein
MRLFKQPLRFSNAIERKTERTDAPKINNVKRAEKAVAENSQKNTALRIEKFYEHNPLER